MTGFCIGEDDIIPLDANQYRRLPDDITVKYFSPDRQFAKLPAVLADIIPALAE
jgi:hypothetical protein